MLVFLNYGLYYLGILVAKPRKSRELPKQEMKFVLKARGALRTQGLGLPRPREARPGPCRPAGPSRTPPHPALGPLVSPPLRVHASISSEQKGHLCVLLNAVRNGAPGPHAGLGPAQHERRRGGPTRRVSLPSRACMRRKHSRFRTKSILFGTGNEVHRWLRAESPTTGALQLGSGQLPGIMTCAPEVPGGPRRWTGWGRGGPGRRKGLLGRRKGRALCGEPSDPPRELGRPLPTPRGDRPAAFHAQLCLLKKVLCFPSN